ncbi:Rv1678 family membrane protein [Pseudarthrobacter sp. S9]|uniref:Rv1678 family membrane protein n=1 Tax=Pseudarthrobacter sp. S9 TaxID=3418421 RepID=UPI003D0059FD
MTGRHIDLPVLALGGAALLSSVFTFSSGGPAQVEFVHIRGTGLVLLLICGVAAVIAGILRLRWLAIASGAALLAGALVQLLQADQSINWLAGDGSTVALLGGLGIGLLAVTLTPRTSSAEHPGSSDQKRTANAKPD